MNAMTPGCTKVTLVLQRDFLLIAETQRVQRWPDRGSDDQPRMDSSACSVALVRLVVGNSRCSTGRL